MIARSKPILSSTHVVAIPIASTAVVYSASFLFGSSKNFSLKYKAASDGTTGLKIELEISNVRPTTEGSVDATNYAVPANFANIESDLADENLHSDAVNPPAFPYMRFKITASGGNDASTVLNLWLSVQEEA